VLELNDREAIEGVDGVRRKVPGIFELKLRKRPGQAVTSP